MHIEVRNDLGDLGLYQPHIKTIDTHCAMPYRNPKSLLLVDILNEIRAHKIFYLYVNRTIYLYIYTSIYYTQG